MRAQTPRHTAVCWAQSNSVACSPSNHVLSGDAGQRPAAATAPRNGPLPWTIWHARRCFQRCYCYTSPCSCRSRRHRTGRSATSARRCRFCSSARSGQPARRKPAAASLTTRPYKHVPNNSCPCCCSSICALSGCSCGSRVSDAATATCGKRWGCPTACACLYGIIQQAHAAPGHSTGPPYGGVLLRVRHSRRADLHRQR